MTTPPINPHTPAGMPKSPVDAPEGVDPDVPGAPDQNDPQRHGDPPELSDEEVAEHDEQLEAKQAVGSAEPVDDVDPLAIRIEPATGADEWR